jgi:hypothetical protein
MAPRLGGPPSRAGWAYQRTEAALIKVLMDFITRLI